MSQPDVVRVATGDIVTHPIQKLVVIVGFMLNIVALVVANKWMERQMHKKQPNNDALAAQRGWTWNRKRNTYWILISCSLLLNITLDYYYDVSTNWIFAKSYIFAFPIGILDLVFSSVTESTSYRVIPGAMLWCSALYIKGYLERLYFGGQCHTTIDCDGMYVVNDLPQPYIWIPREFVRLFFQLLFMGLMSDMIFSPMHRLTHHPYFYKRLHKEHHTYTNNLTSLVLFHGTLLDDFLMPFTTAVGAFLYTVVLHAVCLPTYIGFSNLTLYIGMINNLLSHAHDIKCAQLIAPLPDNLNFVAYHYVHHLSPNSNFGLTEPTDMLWDWILGVKTITKYNPDDNNASTDVANPHDKKKI